MSGEVLIVVRWIHFLAGITWIGLLYWFNLVNVPFMKAVDASARPMVIPTLLPRALAWFRHSAWVTVLAGLLLIYGLYWQRGDIFDSASARTIFSGMVLGLIMLFNVWMIIWPNQRRVIGAVRNGQTPDPAWGRQALYASRTNFTLSFPMLLFMGSATHYPMDWAQLIVVGVVAGGIGLGVVMSVHKYWAARF